MIFKILLIYAFINLVNANHNNCTKHLTRLSEAQKFLLHCITFSSVPVEMCTSCKDFYYDVLLNYDTLKDECKNQYFDKDRINLVASTEAMFTGLWNKAYCDDCFNNNNIIIFNNKYTSLETCLGNKTDKCEQCNEAYTELNNFYINLDQHNNGEVCFDMQDKMNRTRNNWSKTLKCCRREYNMTLFTIALSIIMSVPLLFYISTYFITKRQERNHEVLNDEDSRHDSPLPITSNLRLNSNNINNPSQTIINENPSSSSSTRTANTNNLTSTTMSSPKDVFNINNEPEYEIPATNINGESLEYKKPATKPKYPKNNLININGESSDTSDDVLPEYKIPATNPKYPKNDLININGGSSDTSDDVVPEYKKPATKPKLSKKGFD